MKLKLACKGCGEMFDYVMSDGVFADELLRQTEINYAKCERCREIDRKEADLRQRRQEEDKRRAEMDLSYQRRYDESNLKIYEMGLDQNHPGFNRDLFGFMARNIDNSVYLMGGTGNGKSRILAHYAKIFCQQKGSVYFTTSAALYDNLGAKFSKKPEIGEAFLRQLYAFDLIVIDDLGKETMSETRKTRLWQVIDQRYTALNRKRSGYSTYRRGWQVWIASQCDAATLINSLGDRDGSAIVRRILDSCEIWKG